MKNIWNEEIGELTADLLKEQSDKILEDMKEYIDIIMSEYKAGDINDQQYTKTFLTAMIKITGLELFRRSLDVGEEGFNMVHNMLGMISLELMMKKVLNGNANIQDMFESIVKDHNCDKCTKKDTCPEDKQKEIIKMKAEILLRKKDNEVVN